MSRYIDFDYSTKGLAINLPNGTIKSDQEGCLICDLIVSADISNNSITLDKLDESILNLLDKARVGTQITSTATGNLVTSKLEQFYTVAMNSTSQTITLPDPSNTDYLGAKVTFKRKTNTTVFTITSTGGAGFVPIASVTLSASPISIPETVFQVDLICDGVNWCIIGQE
jgi:hypothetical protein